MTKEIHYDRATRDFAAYLSGEYIGSYGSYLEAERALDELALRQLEQGVA